MIRLLPTRKLQYPASSSLRAYRRMDRRVCRSERPHFALQFRMQSPDNIPKVGRHFETGNRHATNSVVKELAKRISLLCAFERFYAFADLLHKLCIPHNLHSLLPTFVVILADNNSNRLAVTGNRYYFVPSLHCVYQPAKLTLDL